MHADRDHCMTATSQFGDVVDGKRPTRRQRAPQIKRATPDDTRTGPQGMSKGMGPPSSAFASPTTSQSFVSQADSALVAASQLWRMASFASGEEACLMDCRIALAASFSD